ncbi:MAG: amino acid ABC transporter substrate-binding protein [Variibacter sp.]|nr:amino acid ABC transporter substrate-binding protein [Variibacter sp.]
MAAFSPLRRGVCRALALAGMLFAASAAFAADPIKIGFNGSLTGGNAAFGKADLLTKQIWADRVNAKGGLLGRPVQLVFYDDQSQPANIPAIYTKLLDVDKVDLVLVSGTNFAAAAMPVITQRNKMVMSLLSLAVNDNFKYPRYFQIMPYGPNGKEEISRGFFEAAATLDPKPQTLAIAGADAEFAINAMEGARSHARRMGLKIVYDRTYPPNMVEFSSVIRAIQATNPDLVFIGSYPADTVGIIRAALEGNLKTRMFGGGMVGTQFAPVKALFNEGLNGIVNYELYVREPTMKFAGVEEFVAEYRKRAAVEKVDLLGHYVPPFVYAAMQVIEQAVTGTKSLDDGKLAAYIHKTKFSTIVGDIAFGPDGEWTEGRILMTQFQNVKGSGLEQFDKPGTQVILYPPQFKSGALITPFPPPKK